MPAISSSRTAEADSSFSAQFSIRNTLRSPIRNASLAWLDYDRHPLWGDPFDFEKSIPFGEVSTLDLSSKRIRIVEFKIKFFIGGRRYLVEIGHPPDLEGVWFYWTNIEMAVDEVGFYFPKQAWSRVTFE